MKKHKPKQRRVTLHWRASDRRTQPRSATVVCVGNVDYPASLERRKIYLALRDPVAEKHGFLRVIDESGEDYLYPKLLFRPIALPQALKKAVLAAA
jgi:hypothetical protein